MGNQRNTSRDTYIHTYVRTYIHTYIHTHIIYISIYVYMYIHWRSYCCFLLEPRLWILPTLLIIMIAFTMGTTYKYHVDYCHCYHCTGICTQIHIHIHVHIHIPRHIHIRYIYIYIYIYSLHIHYTHTYTCTCTYTYTYTYTYGYNLFKSCCLSLLSTTVFPSAGSSYWTVVFTDWTVVCLWPGVHPVGFVILVHSVTALRESSYKVGYLALASFGFEFMSYSSYEAEIAGTPADTVALSLSLIYIYIYLLY